MPISSFQSLLASNSTLTLRANLGSELFDLNRTSNGSIFIRNIQTSESRPKDPIQSKSNIGNHNGNDSNSILNRAKQTKDQRVSKPSLKEEGIERKNLKNQDLVQDLNSSFKNLINNGTNGRKTHFDKAKEIRLKYSSHKYVNLNDHNDSKINEIKSISDLLSKIEEDSNKLNQISDSSITSFDDLITSSRNQQFLNDLNETEIDSNDDSIMKNQIWSTPTIEKELKQHLEFSPNFKYEKKQYKKGKRINHWLNVEEKIVEVKKKGFQIMKEEEKIFLDFLEFKNNLLEEKKDLEINDEMNLKKENKKLESKDENSKEKTIPLKSQIILRTISKTKIPKNMVEKSADTKSSKLTDSSSRPNDSSSLQNVSDPIDPFMGWLAHFWSQIQQGS